MTQRAQTQPPADGNGGIARELLDELGFGPSRAAWLLGVDSSTVRRWKSGAILVPSGVVQSLRLLLAVKVAAPGLLGILRGTPLPTYLLALRELRPAALPGELDEAARRARLGGSVE